MVDVTKMQWRKAWGTHALEEADEELRVAVGDIQANHAQACRKAKNEQV